MEPSMERRKKLVPRCSSPVTVYVELPCIVDQAFPTIAWDDFEECPSEVAHDTTSFGKKENYYHSEDHDFQECALDLMADSPCMLESSLSSAELPFQGCIIPPLTPQPDVSGEDSGHAHNPHQHRDIWNQSTQLQGSVLGHSFDAHSQIHGTFEENQEEIQGHEDRNHHLKQLASRAKHLAEVLERLMTVSEPSTRECVMAEDRTSLSPCKRQRLDEGYETETDSVEDMLRDISTRCNAVLHSATSTATQREADRIQMFGSFSGLQTSVSDCSVRTDGLEDTGLSFRASVREHNTIKTQVFTHGHAFTTRTPQGGYCFRWVPNQS